jgi:co-chaperonin GroES (HSP10)
MKAVDLFLIEAKDTHKEQTDSGIHLIKNFDNQEKARQIYKIHSVPRKYSKIATVKDLLLVHFNVVVFELFNGRRIPSTNYLKDDIFYVPNNMIHGVIDSSTYEVKHLFDEWNLINPIINNEDKVTTSGIIYELKKSAFELKKKYMFGEVVFSDKIKKGKKVMMETYSDYEVEFPDGKKYWLVKDAQILATYED